MSHELVYVVALCVQLFAGKVPKAFHSINIIAVVPVVHKPIARTCFKHLLYRPRYSLKQNVYAVFPKILRRFVQSLLVCSDLYIERERREHEPFVSPMQKYIQRAILFAEQYVAAAAPHQQVRKRVFGTLELPSSGVLFHHILHAYINGFEIHKNLEQTSYMIRFICFAQYIVLFFRLSRQSRSRPRSLLYTLAEIQAYLRTWLYCSPPR